MNMMARVRYSGLCIGLLLVGFSTGCGTKSDRPEIAVVAGVVTMNGKPLPRAQVAFEPTTGRASYGITDDEGKYALRYLPKVQGAKLGDHVVRISTNIVALDPTTGDEKLNPEIIPPQYNRDSVLTASVHEGTNEIVFDLKTNPK